MILTEVLKFHWTKNMKKINFIWYFLKIQFIYSWLNSRKYLFEFQDRPIFMRFILANEIGVNQIATCSFLIRFLLGCAVKGNALHCRTDAAPAHLRQAAVYAVRPGHSAGQSTSESGIDKSHPPAPLWSLPRSVHWLVVHGCEIRWSELLNICCSRPVQFQT